MTTELSRADAIAIPLLVSEIGTPLLGLAVLAAIASDASPESPLLQELRAQEATFRAAAARLAPRHASVEEALARYGVAVGARPGDAREYLAWSDRVIAAVAGMTGAERPEGALAALARTYGDFVQALALAIVVTHLRRAAPDAPRAVAQAKSLARRLAECADRLRKVAALSSLPSDARTSAQRIVTTAGLALNLGETDAETREAGLKMIRDKLAEEIDELRAAAGG